MTLLPRHPGHIFFLCGPIRGMCQVRRCGLIALDIHVVAILGPSWARDGLRISLLSEACGARRTVLAEPRDVSSAPVRSDGLRISLLSEARGARRTRVRLRARTSLRLELLAPETASHVKEAETGALGTSSRPPRCNDISNSLWFAVIGSITTYQQTS